MKIYDAKRRWDRVKPSTVVKLRKTKQPKMSAQMRKNAKEQRDGRF